MSALLPVTITGTFATSPLFLTNGVKIGDELVPKVVTNSVYVAANAGSATALTGKLLKVTATTALDYDNLYVSEVTSETSLKVIAYKAGVAITDSSQSAQYDLALSTLDTFTFDIVHNLTKDEQVTIIAETAASYGSKRVLYVWPPEADWDGAGSIVDGSAIAAATAAAISAYPAQQSFTNLGFSGPNTLKYSNTYFTPTQLNRLSESGVFVLVQDTPGAQVYARHQKTTSTASIQEQEFSITKAVDKLSLDLASLVKPFIGKYNITQDLLTQLDDVLKQYLFNAKTSSAPYCGSLIIDYSKLVLRANLEGANQDLTPGTVEIAVTCEVGYPANYINIKLFVN